jgi:predicted Zn-dependent protease with MMP-like domain
MNRESFESLVRGAVEALPEEFLRRLENIAVVIDDSPTPAQLKKVGVRHGEILLGLYEGVPLTKRGHNYGLVPPDKITIFQKSIESVCRNEAEIAAEVQRVAQHEIAHYFGLGDARLDEIEEEKLRRNKPHRD